MSVWFAVAAGGAFGSLARHGVNVMFQQIVHRPVPYATAAVNLAGSLAIGLLAGLIASGRLAMSQPLRAFVFVGILGGFTTFSSFMLDTLTVAQSGDRTLAMSNVLGQTGLGVIAVFAGYHLGLLR